MLGLLVYVRVCVICCGLYMLLLNVVYIDVGCLVHGKLWSAVLVCVKDELCIGCG